MYRSQGVVVRAGALSTHRGSPVNPHIDDLNHPKDVQEMNVSIFFFIFCKVLYNNQVPCPTRKLENNRIYNGLDLFLLTIQKLPVPTQS